MARKAEAGPGELPAPAPANAAEAAAQWLARRDAGLTEAEEASFQRWFGSDARHAEAYAQVESAWSLFGKPQRTGEAAQVVALLENRARRRRHRRVAVVAATMALLVITTARTWPLWRESGGTATAPARATLVSPARQTLPDGTIVILKQNARVHEAYTSAVRRVELTQGEAMFEVQKDPSRPFIVQASGVEVRAVGTAFSVQLDRSQVEVVIAEGTVAIAPPTAPERGAGAPAPASRHEPGASAIESLRPPNGVLVKAGNRVLIREGGASSPEVTALAETELHERLAWRQPRVEFSNTPLREAVDLLNREAGATKVIIADRELASLRVSGIFRTEQIDAFVLLLEAGFGVRAERSADEIRLYRAARPPQPAAAR